MAGECGTAFFLSEDYLTNGTDEETRIGVNIGRMPNYPNMMSVPLEEISMGWVELLPVMDGQNYHGLGVNGSLPSFFLRAWVLISPGCRGGVLMMRQVQSISVLLRLHKAAFCLQNSSSIALAALLAALSVFLPETASPGSVVPFFALFPSIFDILLRRQR